MLFDKIYIKEKLVEKYRENNGFTLQKNKQVV